MSRNNFLTIVFLLSTCVNILGQNYIDLLKLNYNYTSLNPFEGSTTNTTISEFDLDATLPIVINDRTAIVTGIITEAFRVKLDAAQESKNIYAINPKLGLSLIHNEKWSGTYVLLPKIASDFQQLNRKDFQIGGFILMKYTKKPNLNFKAGVYANTEFFGPWIVPLLGLYYLNESEKLEVNLTLPFIADINYKISPAVSLGMNFNGITKSYHINKPLYFDSPGYLARASNELFLYTSINSFKNIMIHVKAGHSFGRYYRVYDEDDQVSLGLPLKYFNDNRNQLNSDFADGWVFQLMTIYRLPIQPK